MAIATARVRAPELTGAGGWINTDRPLTLAGLRGRAVLLDFWTLCCVNCLRVVEELRPLERRFGDRLVVIGVHSPKFPHENDHRAVVAAVRRHRVEHPVLDDPGLQTWQRYGVRAWPTLVVVDPDGYIVAEAAGEGNGPAVGELIARILEGRPALQHRAFEVPHDRRDTALASPGKVAGDGGDRLAIADTGHDRVIVCTLDGRVQRVFDGFHQPQGVRFDGDRLLVCDTVAGELVAVALDGGGRQVLAAGMRSPWDAAVLPGGIAVAEAGLHRLLLVPPEGGTPAVLAGTRAEGLRDGPAGAAHLAQPSGLAVLPGGALAIADSEVSALRVLRDGRIETLVGAGLFDWGDADGGREAARLQHPLGVAALGGGIAVADTFNSRLRLWHDGELSTLRLQEDLDEPGGLDALPDGRLVVADTGNDRIVLVAPGTGDVSELVLAGLGDAAGTGAPLAGGAGARLMVPVPATRTADELDGASGPPVRLSVAADPASLLAAGPRSWALDEIPASIEVELGRQGTGVIRVDLVASTCRGSLCSVSRRSAQHALTVSAARVP